MPVVTVTRQVFRCGHCGAEETIDAAPGSALSVPPAPPPVGVSEQVTQDEEAILRDLAQGHVRKLVGEPIDPSTLSPDDPRILEVRRLGKEDVPSAHDEEDDDE